MKTNSKYSQRVKYGGDWRCKTRGWWFFSRAVFSLELMFVIQEYRSDETTAEGVMEGRGPHMFSPRTYRRTGKGERDCWNISVV